MSSSGEYKFDNYNEKLDEVGLVGNGYDNPLYANATTGGNTTMTKPVTLNHSGGGGNKMIFVVIILLLLVVISLLLVLVGMSAYNMTDNKCACDVPNSNEVSGTAQPTATTDDKTQQVKVTCNTTDEARAYLNQVIQVMNGSCQNIFQLLQDQQTMDMDFQANATEMMSNTENSLEHIINTLSNNKDTSISTSSVVDDILIGVNKLLDVHNTSSLYDSITPVSCKMIKDKLPDSPSGYYHVNARDIYCNMDELCGSGGGWTRLAYLDMTDATFNCPDELQYLTYTSQGLRMCQRPDHSEHSCSSPVKFESNGISYSEICGRVIGYQKGTPDGVTDAHGPNGAHDDINSYYVDGISITRGSPRQHVWTFICGLQENYYYVYNCPCNTPPGEEEKVQSFVGTHYFCESGNPNNFISSSTTYTSDPLWDGKGCGSQEGSCCSVDGLPWFHRQYDNSTTDSLDMRICGDESTANEGTPVSFYEIYVK